jgi:hypothetical protein
MTARDHARHLRRRRRRLVDQREALALEHESRLRPGGPAAEEGAEDVHVALDVPDHEPEDHDVGPKLRPHRPVAEIGLVGAVPGHTRIEDRRLAVDLEPFGPAILEGHLVAVGERVAERRDAERRALRMPRIRRRRRPEPGGIGPVENPFVDLRAGREGPAEHRVDAQIGIARLGAPRRTQIPGVLRDQRRAPERLGHASTILDPEPTDPFDEAEPGEGSRQKKQESSESSGLSMRRIHGHAAPLPGRSGPQAPTDRRTICAATFSPQRMLPSTHGWLR